VCCTVCVREIRLSRIHTVILNNIGGHSWKDGGQTYYEEKKTKDPQQTKLASKVNVNILLSTPSSESADSVQDRKRQVIS
jgi:hypothetical protein